MLSTHALHAFYMQFILLAHVISDTFIPRNGTSVPSFENDCHAHHSRVPKPSWNVHGLLGSNQPVHFCVLDAARMLIFYVVFSIFFIVNLESHFRTCMHNYAHVCQQCCYFCSCAKQRTEQQIIDKCEITEMEFRHRIRMSLMLMLRTYTRVTQRERKVGEVWTLPVCEIHTYIYICLSKTFFKIWCCCFAWTRRNLVSDTPFCISPRRRCGALAPGAPCLWAASNASSSTWMIRCGAQLRLYKKPTRPPAEEPSRWCWATKRTKLIVLNCTDTDCRICSWEG